MFRVGRCIGNGPMESFWGTLKCEKYYLHKYQTFEQLERQLGLYPLLQLQTIAGKTKRPQSHGIQDEGRLMNLYFFYCLLDGGQFIFGTALLQLNTSGRTESLALTPHLQYTYVDKFAGLKDRLIRSNLMDPPFMPILLIVEPLIAAVLGSSRWRSASILQVSWGLRASPGA
jgi:transposase InsO family protein